MAQYKRNQDPDWSYFDALRGAGFDLIGPEKLPLKPGQVFIPSYGSFVGMDPEGRVWFGEIFAFKSDGPRLGTVRVV
jgi:hypothetical protein